MAAVGAAIPKGALFEETPGGKVETSDLFAGKKVVLFAVPGAFTPGCSATHLPGYIAAADALKAKGVDTIACVSVNDPFVMAAWGKAHGVGSKIRMLADTDGSWTKAMGLDVDLTAALGNVRSKRYSALVENGVITKLNVEQEKNGTALECSLAPVLLSAL